MDGFGGLPKLISFRSTIIIRGTLQQQEGRAHLGTGPVGIGTVEAHASHRFNNEKEGAGSDSVSNCDEMMSEICESKTQGSGGPRLIQG